jgi:CRISPR-associated protein Cmr4
VYEAAATLVVYAFEPVHVGAASGAGGVDRPVARDARGGDSGGERGDPILTFSALRGAFRDVCPPGLWRLLLGEVPEDSGEGVRGAVTFTDASPLLFPIRSVKGGFAWATCPRILDEFGRRVGSGAPEAAPGESVGIAPGSALALREGGSRPFVVIAGARYSAVELDEIHTWLHTWLGDLSPGAPALAARVVVVPDQVFAGLVARETERRQRVRIERSTGTVAGKALFSLEAVPRDTVFFGSVLALSPGLWKGADGGLLSGDESPKTAEDVLKKTAEILKASAMLTIGGEVTVGMGRCQIRLLL